MSDRTVNLEDVEEVLRNRLGATEAKDILRDLGRLNPPVWNTPRMEEAYATLTEVEGFWFAHRLGQSQSRILSDGLAVEPGVDAENFVTFATEVRDFLNGGRS